jgi:long-chain-fatty-acid--CoA ligase ACSBG
MGKIDKDGFLYITGRQKELIVTSGGENIYPIPLENKLKETLGKYFDNIVVIGDKMKFVSVLLNRTDSSQNLPKDINNVIQTSINDANNIAPSNTSTIKKWLIINSKFKIEDELTPVLKLRRHFIQQKYKDKISNIYS